MDINFIQYKITNIRIYFFLLVLIPLATVGQVTYQLPKALIITTGDGEGRGTIPDGIVYALQAFNKLGVFVRLENRKVLLQPEILKRYNIMVLPTIEGYHDKPRPAALTYMSDSEMKIIDQWVKNGGTLVAGENIGRNDLSGKDRILKKGVLDTSNWILSKCLGVTLKEMNLSGYYFKDSKMNIWQNSIPVFSNKKETWLLVVENKNNKTETLAQWQNNKDTYPALTANKYGKGYAYLLPTFYLLHPDTDGGLSNKKQIDKFYEKVYQSSVKKRKYNIVLSPWRDAKTSAYCQTFDDGGTTEEYNKIINFIKKNSLPTVFFITRNVDKNIARKLIAEPLISVQGHSYSHLDFRKLDYFQTQNEFLMNRQYWKKQFTGFRFPYVSNSFWGMYLLNDFGYVYESSIAANNFEFVRGSVVPYNIPIFNDDFYESLDLLEISQIYRSDWYFYQKLLQKIDYTWNMQKNDADKFKTYLFNYFNKIVKPNHGVMVFLGHPMYLAHSNITLKPLQDFISFLQTQNVWITSLNKIAQRWNKLKNLNISITENQNNVEINIDSGNEHIEGLSLMFDKKPKEILGLGDNYIIMKKNGKYFLIFDVFEKETIKLQY